LIACGERDQRLGASLSYFKQGRALGKPWLWMCAPNTAHEIYPPVEDFVREYFSAILANQGNSDCGEWVDIDLKTKVDEGEARDQPSLTGWLPDSKLLIHWQTLNQP
jgi:hypothetical protein